MPPAGLHGNQERSERVFHWLRAHLTARTVVAAIVALGLLAYVADLANAPHSGAELSALLRRTWWIVFLLTMPYLAARATVWWQLLQDVDVRAPIRTVLVSFAAGEMTKSLPAGDYLANYLLDRLTHFGAAAAVRATMATTAILALESALAVPVVLIVGVPGWNWLFWTIVGLIVAWLVVLIAVWLLVDRLGSHVRPDIHPRLRHSRDLLEEFLVAGRQVLTLRILRSFPLTAVYMLCYVVYLYVMIRAVGVHGISLAGASSIYGFIVLVTILVPIPGELGVTELSGVGVLIAYGVPPPSAAVIMLGLRILGTGWTIVQSGAIVLALRGQLRAAGRESAQAIAPSPEPSS